MERVTLLTQGGIYLARLDPSKHAEVGKIRPVVVLMGQFVLDVQPASALVCPLSSQSYPECSQLHVALPPRDALQKDSYALVEHCRSISVKRLIEPRLAQLTMQELGLIFIRLRHMCNMDHTSFVIQT
ncbi:MAG: type II toxin-antitoxin system PemK/MazF family toxin [Legionellaceae bacterium]|nr:type II toxin-antitoxin system PemK/MazF family toxin [Legionellaceae bacterium]